MKKLFSLLLIAVALVSSACQPKANQTEDVSFVSDPQGTLKGFEAATGPRELDFPLDFGPHPNYRSEWWYYTGNLETEEGRHFGYQLTFFRQAALPAKDRAPRQSEWGVEQVYMAHFTLTDTDGESFLPFERFSRGSAGLAGAQIDPNFDVWLDDWRVSQNPDQSYTLFASANGLSLDLQLWDEKGPVLQGVQGYSQKGPEPGNASYYISQTRLRSEGRVTLDDQVFEVSGLSWMDHEFSTSALRAGLIGWNWFSLQLDDGSELMLYTLRREDGGVDHYSSGTIINQDGTTRALKPEDYSITPFSEWTSPHSGAIYPSAWLIQVPSIDLEIEVQPRLPDQELNLTFTYWEGAVKFSGQKNGQPVSGVGYVELTGYARSMQGEF